VQFWLSSHVIAIYKELQSLRKEKRETHTVDVPSSTLSKLDPEIYMVQSSASANKAQIALLDIASTHTVLQDQTHFEFKTQNEPWQTCDIVTIAGKRNFKFREGRAVVILPGGAPPHLRKGHVCPGRPSEPDQLLRLTG
jgi:hypothetical protein